MADLTILSPQPFLAFSISPQISARYSNSASLFSHSTSIDHDVPASPASPPSSRNQQLDSSLLSPPHNSFRSAPRVRRVRPERRLRPSTRSPTVLEDDESLTDASEEDLDPAEIQETSYTDSFRPFCYPSTPSLLGPASHPQSDLARPQPPLFRPKTFWRNTRRSALTGPSYSPSSYLVRRSTFIAAGLTLDNPHADLSALGVELRIGSITLVPSTTLPL
ncbi:hypothetical protein M0805_007411 [Coniferiporia weirii]|nr:hypothetical protein M0805_007411 [Coniferiporia weirii]